MFYEEDCRLQDIGNINYPIPIPHNLQCQNGRVVTYIANVITSAFPTPKNATIAPATAVRIGSFAPHEKNGITLIVAVFSFSSAKVRVLIIAGTEQPKPIIIGMNARPDKPNLRKILSKIKATRAIYPVSSIMEKNRNKNKICGKNPRIANKPDKTPSQIKPWNQTGTLPSIAPPTASMMAPKDISKKLKSITPGEAIPPSTQKRPS